MVRFKNRYITVEVKQEKNAITFKKLNSKDLSYQILGTVNRLYGDFGFAAIKNGFAASYCNEVTQIAILRARHGPHKLVISALPVITSIADVPVVIKTLYVGATLHQCYKIIMRYQKEALLKLLPKVKPENKLMFEREMMNINGFLPKNRRVI